MPKFNIVPLIMTSLLLSIGCAGTFNKMGANLGEGIAGQTDTIAQQAVTGIANGLDNPENQEKIRNLVDLLVADAIASLDSNLNAMDLDTVTQKFFASLQDQLSDPVFRDSITGFVSTVIGMAGTEGGKQLRQVLDEVIAQLDSEETRQRIASLRNSLIGPQAGKDLQAMFQQSLDNILTDTAAAKLRHQLFGPATNEAIQAIVDSAMMTIVYRLDRDINPNIQANISFIQKNARELLFLLGLMAFGIAAYLWNQRKKYLKISNVLTGQIFEMSNQRSFDELTVNIKQKAIDQGVEADLRQLLRNNGLLSKESWESYQGKKKN